MSDAAASSPVSYYQILAEAVYPLSSSSDVIDGLTSSTRASEHTRLRLAAVGDRVLELILSERLLSCQRWGRADFVRTMNMLRANRTLAYAVEQLGANCGRRNRRRTQHDNSAPAKALADAFEATIGAIFISSGYEDARKAVVSLYGETIQYYVAKYHTGPRQPRLMSGRSIKVEIGRNVLGLYVVAELFRLLPEASAAELGFKRDLLKTAKSVWAFLNEPGSEEVLAQYRTSPQLFASLGRRFRKNGYTACRSWFERNYTELLLRLHARIQARPSALLEQICIENKLPGPRYFARKLPSHLRSTAEPDEPQWCVEIRVGRSLVGLSWGPSRKSARRTAAAYAVENRVWLLA